MKLSPALRESIRSWTVSQALAIWTILLYAGTQAYGAGLLTSPQAAWAYLVSNWWNMLLALVLGIGPYHRATQAWQKATAPPPPRLVPVR